MSKELPIVVVAFNRANSLIRLLTSINDAFYEVDDVPLIISIDKCDSNNNVLEIAEDFQWKHGDKIVVYQKENLKLRKHILKCGDYALEYGNVIILEDDLYVSKFFYKYAECALRFSGADDRIGGVSLYNHRFNVEASEPFEAIDDGYDNWYFQFASSWGEAWTQKQWSRFREWYAKSPNIDERDEVPQYVRSWSSSSWLKYFIAYLVEKDMYFIYPKKSLTTNFGEAGTHVNKNNPNHQVPLQNAEIEYKFSTFDQSNSIYDAYFESIYVKKQFEIEGKSVSVDLYGKKPLELIKRRSEFILTRRPLPYRIVRKYGCCMRPHEENIINCISGDDFFLYDLGSEEKVKVRFDDSRKMQYNLRYIDRTQYGAVVKMCYDKTKNGIKNRIKKKIDRLK